MTVKEHYDHHLGHFYAWMLGDFEEKKNSFASFCREHGIVPHSSGLAIDLGAGHGIQSVALAELGFRVLAIDFNTQLLDELAFRRQQLPIETIYADIQRVKEYADRQPELIVCCGDTLPHLSSMDEIARLIGDAYDTLLPGGKLLLSFRDYSHDLTDTSRFIPVKSDANRILTCFLEYLPNTVRVTDLLHELIDGQWQQKVSSYEKVRVSEEAIVKAVENSGFEITLRETSQRMITLRGQK